MAGVLVSACGNPEKHSRAAEPVDSARLEVLEVEARFLGVREMVVSEGAIWVLDRVEPFITRVSTHDHSTIRFGVRGEGPGEFSSPWALQVASAGGEEVVTVWDLGNGRVSMFDTAGALVEGGSLSGETGLRARGNIREVSYADPFRVRRVPAGTLVGQFPRRIDRTADYNRGGLHLTDPELGPGEEIVRFADHLLPEDLDIKEWVSVPLWDTCEGGVVLWDPRVGEVRWFSPSEGTEWSKRVSARAGPVSLRDIEKYLRKMGRLEVGPDYLSRGIDYRAVARRYRPLFSDHHPLATELRCEDRNTVWLRMFNTEDDPLGRSREWLRVAWHQEDLAVLFPIGFTPFVFTESTALGVLLMPDGSEALTVVELEGLVPSFSQGGENDSNRKESDE